MAVVHSQHRRRKRRAQGPPNRHGPHAPPPDPRAPYDLAEPDQWTLAYGFHIHKSQGSEYPAFVMPLLTEHYIMRRRNLLYTGMTRGKQLVVILGQRRALELAIRNTDDLYRTTKLREWLESPPLPD